MNKISEQFFEAIDVAMNEKLSQLQFDKTIKANIVSVENLDTGEYKVEYQDGIISVFAADPKETFKVGDLVYVTVPGNDFGNKKFISHRITNNSLSTAQYSELANTIIEVSPNFSDLGYYYQNPNQEIGYALTVGNQVQEIPILQDLTDEEREKADIRFKAYLDKYEYIQISGSFYNQFTHDHSKGDYGIRVVFTTLEDKELSYSLNLSHFNGDPYHFTTWSPQSVVIKIPRNQIKNLSNIYFYQEGFESETSEGSDITNLFMKDPVVKFVDKKDLTEISYYLNILPLDGLVFTNDLNKLSLKAQLLYYGDIVNDSLCSYQWFKKNLSISSDDTGYDKLMGNGWEMIQDATSQIFEVNEEDIGAQQEYAILVIYNSTVSLTQSIVLMKEPLEVEIKQEIIGQQINLFLSNNDYVGEWYYRSSNGEYIQITEDKTNKIENIQNYLIFSPITFYCSVFNIDNLSRYQGELSYIIRSMESENDISVIFSGQSLFSYDADGHYKIDDAVKEKSIQADIIWKEGINTSALEIEWLDYNNEPVSSSTLDSNSMIQSVWTDNNKLYFTIKNTFRASLPKYNTFKLCISTIDGQKYIFEKEISFIKTGDPGTNGTRYQALISISSDSTNKFVDPENNNKIVTLKCDVYKDNELFENNNNLKFTWSLFNLELVNKNNNKIQVKAKDQDERYPYKRYVKVTINITDEGKITELYNFFPVNTCNQEPNIDLTELPDYVQYTSSGRNPQCRTQVPVISFEDLEADIISLDEENLIIRNDRFIPSALFDPDNNVGLLKITIGNLEIYHPVPMYINTFGNEAINGWDGVSVDVDTEGGKILAPQVGAGTKDSANKFTGVVMGKDSAQQKIGLYGYQAGVNSFGLTEEGKAYFGVAGKGRITIDGTKATIEGGGGGKDSSGMTITLSATESSEDAIRVGNGNFIVNYGGKLTAKSADIEGRITAGAGTIGKWNIQRDVLYNKAIYLTGDNILWYDVNRKDDVNYTLIKGSQYFNNESLSGEPIDTITANTNIYLRNYFASLGSYGFSFTTKKDEIQYYTAISNVAPGTDANTQKERTVEYGRIWAGQSNPQKAPFWVSNTGTLFATNAIIKGDITAKTGYIGGENGWTIDSKKIYGVRDNKYVVLSTNNDYALFAGASSSDDISDNLQGANVPFSVKFDGSLTATAATITGTINATKGQIGYWRIQDGLLTTSFNRDATKYSISLNGSPMEVLKASAKYWAKEKDAKDRKEEGVFFQSEEQKIQNCEIMDSGIIKFKFEKSNQYYYTTAENVGGSVILIKGQRGNATFSVSDEGVLSAEQADINGTIIAESGKIGNLEIRNKGLYFKDSTYKVDSSAEEISVTSGWFPNGVTVTNLPARENFVLWSGIDTTEDGNNNIVLTAQTDRNPSYFGVTKSGVVYSSGANLHEVQINSGMIGPFEIFQNDRSRGLRYYDSQYNVAFAIDTTVFACHLNMVLPEKLSDIHFGSDTGPTLEDLKTARFG